MFGLVWIGGFGLACLVWYVWFSMFGLVCLVWYVWFGMFGLACSSSSSSSSPCLRVHY